MTLDELRARATIDRDGYRVFDGEFTQMAVTLEDAEFLHALVRLIRPLAVLELGTGLGISAKFIAEALKGNNRGELYTVEPNEGFRQAARDLLVETGGRAMVVCPGEPRVGAPPELVFVDSGYQTRPADIREWLTNGYRGLVCVHDANREYAELALGVGVFLPGSDGLWLGRGA